MAVGNREAYSETSKSTNKILQVLRNLVRPDLKDSATEIDTNINERLMNMWKERFGDPDEAEQKLRERDAKLAQEAAAARIAAVSEAPAKIRNAQEFIQKRLFR
jgi:5'-deoxynucleotidase YfbR-like HD superfamily hydrolase